MDKFTVETVNTRGKTHSKEFGYRSDEANQYYRQCKMLGLSAKMYREDKLIATNKGV